MSENSPEPLLTDIALQLLNTLQTHDPEACADLMAHRTPVVDTIAHNEDFICQTARGGKVQIGVLGLINSLLVKAGQPKIAAVVDDDATVIGFTKRSVETLSVTARPPAPPKN